MKATLKEVKHFKEMRGWKSVGKSRAVFRTHSSINDGAFLQKQLIASSYFCRKLHHMFDLVLNTPLKRMKLSR